MSEEKRLAVGTDLQQYVSFFLGDEEYGVDIAKVHEIIRFPEITRVPQMPEFIDGVINLRGRVIPVMNLRKKFALPIIDDNNKRRIIVIEIDKKITGVIVDGVSEVLNIESVNIDPAPQMGTQVSIDFIKGMAKLSDERLMILLNIERILSSDEMQQLKTVGENEAGENSLDSEEAA